MPRVVMISNYINHHQIPFCNEMYGILGEDYTFIQTEPMEAERADMGWSVDESAIPYLKLLYKDEEACRKLIDECDMLLVGWQEREDLIIPRMKQGKLTVRISERLYREGRWKAVSPKGLLRKYKEHTRFRNSDSAFLLCNGSYVAGDFSLIHAYPDKMYKFGYFPEFRKLDASKKPPMDEIQLIWAGRFMPLKHPEYVVRLAADMVDMGYNFRIHFIGSGEMEEDLKATVAKGELEDYVFFYGFISPGEVRELMDGCHIHLFTSNHLEGWGAVVNEGMNSGLAEVVSIEAGAAQYLIRNGKNGLLYDGSYEDLREKVLMLMDDHAYIERLGQNAYETIATLWNPKHAAEEVMRFYEGYKAGKIEPPAEGPMSKA
ncbi:MAG: glycosyltransferase family 4 protein [Lachnospiraceae bacterium]|nr:glycosyltransferase family 4 protein [Lachnospiraceae bacterium]